MAEPTSPAPPSRPRPSDPHAGTEPHAGADPHTGAGPHTGAAPESPHAHTAAETLTALNTSATEGLSSAEAARRLSACGPNELARSAPTPIWQRILRLVNEPLTYLLLAAIVVSVIAWAAEGAAGWPVDAVVIAVVIVLNTLIGLIQELKAADAVAALTQMTSLSAAVTRDGRQQSIDAAGLVPGDIIQLAEGDAVPADARLIAGTRLMVAEAALTGESVPVEKSLAALPADTPLADRTSMVHAGTAVTQGSARAVVTGTGAHSQIGQIAGMIQTAGETITPLQKEMAAIGRMLTVAVVAIALIVMVTVFAMDADHSVSALVTVLLLGVSLAVAAVPEGLTAIVSMILALGVRRMADHAAIVKRLDAVESLGSAGVVCTDKTGTLTLNRMTIDVVVTADGRTSTADPAAAPTLVLGALACDAQLSAEGPIGDPTEVAFLLACAQTGRAVPRVRRLDELPFTSERKRMSVLITAPAAEVPAGSAAEEAVAEAPAGSAAEEAPAAEVSAGSAAEASGVPAAGARLIMKGAPDVILARCSRVRTAGGVVPASPEVLAALEEQVTELARQAYRMLAVAVREVPAASGAGTGEGTGASSAEGRDVPVLAEEMEEDLTFVGLVGMIDPPRPEAAAAIAQAQAAGIRVMMITGDHPLTAERIAADLGIAQPRVRTGAQLSGLDDEAFDAALAETSVFARVDPAHKLRIVRRLQHHGHVVAMTGDGVNDAPALKRADIGVAMGITGTQVSHDAATMILADDNFASIITAVKQGRGIFANLTRVLRYLMSSNMGEVLTVFGGVVLAGVLGMFESDGTMILPLLATQILWVNLVTDSIPALALGVDPVEDDVMQRPPRRMDQRALGWGDWGRILLTGLMMALLCLTVLDACLPGGLIDGGALAGWTPGSDDPDTARTVAFTLLVLLQLLNTFSVRHAHRSMFTGLLSNHWLWLAIGVVVLLQLLVIYLPVLSAAFSTRPLDGAHWLLIACGAVVFVAAEEGRKLLARALRRH